MTSFRDAGVPRSRRAVLTLAFASAVAFVLDACGTSKSAAGKSGTASPTTSGSSAKSAAPTVAPSTAAAAAPTTTTATVGGSQPVAIDTASGDPIATGSTLSVDFTFAVGSEGFGPARNPYMAVWVEDANSLPVRTLLISVQQGKGQRWWNELRRWFRLDQARQATGGADLITTKSSPTKVPGTYKVAWDGLDDNGKPATQGSYFICLEAAREHGPYGLIRDQVAIGNQPFQKTLTPNGELTSASVAFTPA